MPSYTLSVPTRDDLTLTGVELEPPKSGWMIVESESHRSSILHAFYAAI